MCTITVAGRCHLYTPAALGIDAYIKQRESMALLFKNKKGTFMEQMTQVLGSQNRQLIFTEDLKNMVHLTEAAEDEMTTVMAMMKK